MDEGNLKQTKKTYASAYVVAGTDDGYEDGGRKEYTGRYISKPVDLSHGNVEVVSNWRRKDCHQKPKEKLKSMLTIIGNWAEPCPWHPSNDAEYYLWKIVRTSMHEAV